jgi:hydrogenase maturation protein HypF
MHGSLTTFGADELIRLAVKVTGVVQGVGFRPLVYNLATTRSLQGFVRNSGGAVEIEVEGRVAEVFDFVQALKQEAPPLATITDLVTAEVPGCGESERGFRIDTSRDRDDLLRSVAPDAATCQECLHELFDPQDRRYRYPFINCTNCGPRFTIIKSLPYDRPNTTMAEFALCGPCRREYDDPGNRRFHAQPNACPQCGPALKFLPGAPGERRNAGGGRASAEAAIGAAVQLLRQGGILALKGLGGFHLMCDARREEAVHRLRDRKGRYGKPLAVMVSSVEMARQFCVLSEAEEGLLQDARGPIVLLEKRDGTSIAPAVAPQVDRLGVMLPNTPLQHLVMADFDGPLVATSGNRSEEPVAIDNDRAIEQLSEIADAFLVHNRPILSRYDDSVAQVCCGTEIMVRRSRGYAPVPLEIPVTASIPVLACGGHLKNTFCLVNGTHAFVSQHIGDLDNPDTLDHFQESLERFRELLAIEPEVIAHDLHPDYLSTALAREIAGSHGLATLAVQHHHAHIASCMAEHGLMGPVIGVAFDGLGYGLDGSAWGGEFLVCDWKSFARRAHFEPVPMPGGLEAVKRPWRMALGYAFAEREGKTPLLADFVGAMETRYGSQTIALIRQQVDKKINAPLTSSCGRLFDCMAALLGICLESSYEGQAAMALESLAREAVANASGERTVAAVNETDPYQFEILSRGDVLVIRPGSILASTAHDIGSGAAACSVALKFHRTIAEVIVEACRQISRQTGLNDVCLSGGVFQNALLLEMALLLLSREGLRVYFQRRVPSNDGGLSLGQAVVALTRARGCTPGFGAGGESCA